MRNTTTDPLLQYDFLAPSILDSLEDLGGERRETRRRKKVAGFLLPENRSERFLSAAVTALVSAIALQYLLFPGFGLARRVLPLLVPPPVAQAFKYLVPEDLKTDIAGSSSIGQRFVQLLDGKDTSERKSSDSAEKEVASPSTTTTIPVALPSVPLVPVLALNPTGSFSISAPPGSPLAPGDRFQRVVTIETQNMGPTWDLYFKPSARHINGSQPPSDSTNLVTTLQINTDACAVPWTQTSASPERYSCARGLPGASAQTTFDANSIRVVPNVANSTPIYLRVLVSWPDVGPTDPNLSSQQIAMSVEFSAVVAT